MTKLGALANKVSSLGKRLRKLEKVFGNLVTNMNTLLPLIVNFGKVVIVLKKKGIVTGEDLKDVEEPITSEHDANSQNTGALHI